MSQGPDDAYTQAVHSKLGRSSFGRTASADMPPEAAEMAKNRRANHKTGNAGAGASGGVGLQFATGRPRDPLFYWKQNNLPYDFNQPNELARIRQYCRLLYSSHPIIASAIDIYTKYPLQGMELECKDQKLTDFYTELFLGDDSVLNYKEFLIDVGREYWTVGEAMCFGAFDEDLGVWESEELLDPDTVDVEKSPFLRDPRFYIELPKTLREVITTRSPPWEYEQLMAAYPELARYTGQHDKMPVSGVLLKQLRFKGDTFNKRGVPILMRAMRSVMQEEMLNSAMDAIADRLYTPLIHVRLGASATDLGTTVPWIPTADDREEFNESLDAALAADFRVMTTHFATQIELVFGREQMPDLTADFERIEGRILQTFGLSQTMLSGASGGETYAADALNRDLISQLLTTYQRMLQRHFYQRAMIVAEAQEHYDYEIRNGKRYVKMEEIVQVDEETGERTIVEQPKLLVPTLKFKSMTMSDEDDQRQFFEQLRAAGVPISMRTRLVNSPIDFDDEIEKTKAEQVDLAVAEQETRKDIYMALKSKALPIPQDLRDDFEPHAIMGDALENPQAGAGEGSGRAPMLGMDDVQDAPNLAPTEQDFAAVPPGGGAVVPGQPTMPVDPTQEGADVPPESNEMRQGMPTAAALYRASSRTREAAKAQEHKPDALPGFDTPRHVGVRSMMPVDGDTEIDESRI
jgi:hypothetical protein